MKRFAFAVPVAILCLSLPLSAEPAEPSESEMTAEEKRRLEQMMEDMNRRSRTERGETERQDFDPADADDVLAEIDRLNAEASAARGQAANRRRVEVTRWVPTADCPPTLAAALRGESDGLLRDLETRLAFCHLIRGLAKEHRGGAEEKQFVRDINREIKELGDQLDAVLDPTASARFNAALALRRGGAGYADFESQVIDRVEGGVVVLYRGEPVVATDAAVVDALVGETVRLRGFYDCEGTHAWPTISSFRTKVRGKDVTVHRKYINIYRLAPVDIRTVAEQQVVKVDNPHHPSNARRISKTRGDLMRRVELLRRDMHAVAGEPPEETTSLEDYRDSVFVRLREMNKL